MPTDSLYITHYIGGGFASDYGPSTDATPDNNVVVIPWLNVADNIVFTLDKGFTKTPGTRPLNENALESGAVIKGIFDWWNIGAAGSPAQHRVIHIGSKIKRDDGDGAFTDLFTGLVPGAVPSYAVLEDLLVIASDGGDVPKSWNGSTAQDLAGSPPAFTFSRTHKNRMWAAGDPTKPSRLYYSVLLDAADWTGSGSGYIDIDPSDGDKITALVSHKNDLWVFKGPYRNSIHRLTGSSPTGDDSFARIPFSHGVSACGHRMTFSLGDDIGFVGPDGGIYTLSATASYGDYRKAALSYPISTWVQDYVNFQYLHHGEAVDWPEKGQVWITLPINAGTVPNIILVLDYRFQPAWFSFQPAFDMVTSLSKVIDATNNRRPILMAGCNDGYVRKLGQTNKSIDGSGAYVPRIRTPSMTYGAPHVKKTMRGGAIGIAPKTTADIELTLYPDLGGAQQINVTQAGAAARLATDPGGNDFLLDTDVLAGSTFSQQFFEGDYGEFRYLAFDVAVPGLEEDLEVHSVAAVIERGGWSFENA